MKPIAKAEHSHLSPKSPAKLIRLSHVANQAQRGAASAFRFMDELPAGDLATLWPRLHSDELPVEVAWRQRELVLMDKPATHADKLKQRTSRVRRGH